MRMRSQPCPELLQSLVTSGASTPASALRAQLLRLWVKGSPQPDTASIVALVSTASVHSSACTKAHSMRTFLSGPAHTHSLTADVYNVPACFPARAQVTGWIKATYLVPKSDMRRGMDAVLQAARATSAHGALAVTVADQGHHSCAAGSSARGVVVRQNTGIQRTRGASVPALRTVQGEDDEFRLDSAADAGSGDGLIVGMPAAPGQADIGIASEEPTACEHEGSHDDTHLAAVMYAPRVGAAGAVDGAPLGGATTEGAATTARVTAAAGPATAGALEGSAVDGAAVLAALSSAAAERADAGSAAEGAAPAAAAGLATHARAARSNAARPPRAQRHSTSGGGPEEAERSGAGSRPPAGCKTPGSQSWP